MDPITHMATGAVAGRIARGAFATPLAWVFAIACAMIPDVDVFFPGDAEVFLSMHRGITHSLLCGAGLGVLVAIVFRLITPKLPLRRTLLPAVGIVYMHLFLDVMTTYGTQLLAPFSNWRAALPGLFIIDIFFVLTLGLVWFLSFRARRHGRLMAWAGIVWIFFYPLACMNLGKGLQTRLTHRLVEQQEAGPGVTAVHVIPDALAPVYWKVIAERGDEVLFGPVRMGGSGDALELETMPAADRQTLRKLAEHDSFFATYDWFVDYPVVHESTDEEGNKSIEYRDLRFTTAVPFLRSLMNGSGQPWPFSLTARFSPGGEYLGLRFNRHGKAFIRPSLE